MEGVDLIKSLNVGAAIKADRLAALVGQRGSLAEAEKLYADLYGGDTAQALMKRFGPKLAKYGAMFGLPTGLLAGAADPGAFSGVFDAVGKVFSLFGLG